MKTTKDLVPRISRQSGVSLIEIMLALMLSLILLAGVGQIYISSKQTYRVQDGQSRLQENVRYALDLLTENIRETGFQGCRRLGSTNIAVIGLAPANDFSTATAITGYDAEGTGWESGWNPVLPVTLTNVVIGTDVITVQYGATCGGMPIDPATSTNTSLSIPSTNSCNVGAADMLLVADCDNVDVFRASAVATNAGLTTVTINGIGNSQNNLSKAYTLASAELMRFNSYTYYIRLDVNGQPALWRMDNTVAAGGNNPVALVEGIEDMQVVYGVDTDGDNIANQFQTAAVVANWAQVVSVRITLTARSVGENADRLTTTQRNYVFNGANTQDYRLVKTFTSTISLRNRQN
jgi:type IV pilus assembly protein PilW